MDGPVLVTGAAGLLGTWLLRTAPDPDIVVAAVRRRPVAGVRTVSVDLRRRNDVIAVLEQVAPRVVVHAAYEKDRASIVDATRHIVDAARAVGASTLFVSSDTVFGGDGSVRDEDDPTDPSFDYGRWKAEAERIVLEGGDRAVVVRLPLLVSLEPDDHVVARIRRARRSGEITRWYTDEFRQPVWTSEVAAAHWQIIGLGADERAGCWHLPGAERLSRFEHAARIVARIDCPEASISPATQPAGSDRPRDLMLGDARARRAVDWRPSRI